MITRTLLLGAGFSNNFGLPLAKDVLLEMFNIAKSENLKLEILEMLAENDYDFEEYYSKKTFNMGNDEAIKITDILLNVYKSMDETVLRSFSNEQFNYLKVISFINKFSAYQSGIGYVFTLNQDLLVERLFSDYLKQRNFYVPNGWGGESQGDLLPYYGPIDSPFHKYHKNDNRDKNESVDLSNVTQDMIDVWVGKYGDTYEKKTRKTPCLVKLHGTYYWHKNDRKEMLWGIGKNKLEQIKNEPLLNLQYQKFKQVLVDKSIDMIYIIGYSFNDSHINEILYQSCINGAKLIVLDILPINKFFSNVDLAFQKIDKIFNRSWLNKYIYANFKTLFDFDRAKPHIFSGNRDESLRMINEIPCSLIE